MQVQTQSNFDAVAGDVQRRQNLIELKPAHKIQNFRSKNKDVQVLNSTAIASGYAGRDPQGGLAIEAFKVFFFNWNLYEEKRKFFFVLRNENEKERVRLKLKRKR